MIRLKEQEGLDVGPCCITIESLGEDVRRVLSAADIVELDGISSNGFKDMVIGQVILVQLVQLLDLQDHGVLPQGILVGLVKVIGFLGMVWDLYAKLVADGVIPGVQLPISLSLVLVVNYVTEFIAGNDLTDNELGWLMVFGIMGYLGMERLPRIRFS